MDTETGPTRRRRLRAGAGLAAGLRVHESLDDVQRLVVGASAVANVLPEAITEGMKRRHQAVEVALEPVIFDTVRTFARREADLFGELLAPTIGAAVRKAVADAMAVVMQRVNETLERSFSLEGLRWRLEAQRTGLPFADVVLAHTLVYRIEQLLLLHVRTGLVLQHVVAEGAPSNDPDQVSAMLSAIDAFSREAFQERAAGVHLHEIAIGDLKVWIDWDQTIALAAVIRGGAPREVFELIREARERVYLGHREELATFATDVTPFERDRPALEECLQERRREPRKRGQVVLAALLAVILVLVAGLWANAARRHRHQVSELNRCHDVLAAEPGLVVTSAAMVDGHCQIIGLRDPLARDPAEVVAKAGLASGDLRFASFESLAPPIVAERARHALHPPDGVALDVEGSTLRIWGEAPRGWIEGALTAGAALAGVSRIDHDELRADEPLLALRSAAALLEEQRVTFAPGSAALDDSARRGTVVAADLVRSVRILADQTAFTACVTAMGHTDLRGTSELNTALAGQRAAAVAATLMQRGAGPDAWYGTEHGRGVPEPEVRFSVVLLAGRVDCEQAP